VCVVCVVCVCVCGVCVCVCGSLNQYPHRKAFKFTSPFAMTKLVGDLNLEFVSMHAYKRQVRGMVRGARKTMGARNKGRYISQKKQALLADCLSSLGFDGKVTRCATKAAASWKGLYSFKELREGYEETPFNKDTPQDESEEESGDDDQATQQPKKQAKQQEQQQEKEVEDDVGSFGDFQEKVRTMQTKKGMWQAFRPNGGKTKGFESLEELWKWCVEEMGTAEQWKECFVVKK
jgi:hypothetical protein